MKIFGNVRTGNADHMADLFSAIDAERFSGHAARAALFLQLARYDCFITVEQANRYAAAAVPS